MSPIFDRWLPFLALASLLAPGIGCQKWNVVEIGLGADNIADLARIDLVKVEVHEVRAGSTDGGYTHEGTANVGDSAVFSGNKSIGVYLPTSVRRFNVQVDAYAQGCLLLTATADFDLDASHAALTLTLMVTTDPHCLGVVADASDGRDDVSDGLGDRGDLADATLETGPDAGPDLCGTDVPKQVCFDPADAGADAGAPKPIVEDTPNPECTDYCADMASCPSIFANRAACLTVCTRAGWHLKGDGNAGTPLSCLAAYAGMVNAAIGQDRDIACNIADVSSGNCGEVCPTYCALRDRLCEVHSITSQDCVNACSLLLANRRPRVLCFLQVLERDVPRDNRLCASTALDAECGRCAMY